MSQHAVYSTINIIYHHDTRNVLALDYESRLAAVKQSTLISQREERKVTRLLYRLEELYVEVYYHRRYNRVIGLYGFDDTELLTPYLQEISVPRFEVPFSLSTC